MESELSEIKNELEKFAALAFPKSLTDIPSTDNLSSPSVSSDVVESDNCISDSDAFQNIICKLKNIVSSHSVVCTKHLIKPDNLRSLLSTSDFSLGQFAVVLNMYGLVLASPDLSVIAYSSGTVLHLS